ncbi:MAG: beta-propeller fold lactonase family protein [Thermoleophilaceae bacterium]|nr:beta-propeller fold lactonase family protein [Thermoleophilaceae bacterium]
MCSPDIRQLAALILLLSGLTLSLLFSSTADGATVGSLRQLAAPAGCVADGSAPITGCTSGRAMLGIAPFFGSHAVALSPDGKNLYAAAFNSDRVVAFDRSPRSGKLVQRNGATGRGMLKPTSVAVSRDGRSVYVASIVGSAIAVFDRNTKTGTLKQKSGSAGCVARSAELGCAVGRALDGVDVVVVSPGGGNVYAGSFASGAIVSFDRSSSGRIVQKSGGAGCTVEVATSGCRTGRALKGAEGMTISPDGGNVYVGAAIGNAVAVFRRNGANGELSQPTGPAGCVAHNGAGGCASGDGLVGADSMQVSPDNKNLYVASGVGSSVAIFRRSTTSGRLTQLSGVAGCFTDRTRDLGRCNTGIELDQPEGIAVSPDGRTVYVGSFASSAVTVFDRTGFTGTITQRAGAHGCFVNVATAGCTTATALGNANALAISRDGRSVYVGSYSSNAVAAFDRAEPKAGHVTVSVPNRLGVPNGSVISIPVTCSGTAERRCPGGISIALSGSASGSRRGGSFNIAVGDSDDVSVVMPDSVRRALSANGSATVTVTMRVAQPSGRIAVFRQQMRLGVSELG